MRNANDFRQTLDLIAETIEDLKQYCNSQNSPDCLNCMYYNYVRDTCEAEEDTEAILSKKYWDKVVNRQQGVETVVIPDDEATLLSTEDRS